MLPRSSLGHLDSYVIVHLCIRIFCVFSMRLANDCSPEEFDARQYMPQMYYGAYRLYYGTSMTGVLMLMSDTRSSRLKARGHPKYWCEFQVLFFKDVFASYMLSSRVKPFELGRVWVFDRRAQEYGSLQEYLPAVFQELGVPRTKQLWYEARSCFSYWCSSLDRVNKAVCMYMQPPDMARTRLYHHFTLVDVREPDLWYFGSNCHYMGIYEFPEEGYDLPEGKLETELEYTLYVGAMAARVA